MQRELEEFVERLAQEWVRMVRECPEMGVCKERAVGRVLFREVFCRELSCGVFVELTGGVMKSHSEGVGGRVQMRWPTVSTQHAITRANFVSASSGETCRSSLSEPVLSFAITFVQYSRMLAW